MAVVIVLGSLSTAQAWPKWLGGRRAADKTRDGQVDSVERKKATKVDTRWEEKADKNNDGVVETVEARKAVIAAKSKVNRPWEAKADTNKDGHLSAEEFKTYRLGLMDMNHDGKIEAIERKNFWATQKYVVNTPLEKKYDANSDGFITGDEAVEFLKDRVRVISTEGRAIVNSSLEQEFDLDNDGVISGEEAKAIKDAIGD
jgi:Ca2+-binding EF-hand superfamily protein